MPLSSAAGFAFFAGTIAVLLLFAGATFAQDISTADGNCVGYIYCGKNDEPMGLVGKFQEGMPTGCMFGCGYLKFLSPGYEMPCKGEYKECKIYRTDEKGYGIRGKGNVCPIDRTKGMKCFDNVIERPENSPKPETVKPEPKTEPPKTVPKTDPSKPEPKTDPPKPTTKADSPKPTTKTDTPKKDEDNGAGHMAEMKMLVPIIFALGGSLLAHFIVK